MKQHTSKNILFLVLRDIKYERLLNECGEKEKSLADNSASDLLKHFISSLDYFSTTFSI